MEEQRTSDRGRQAVAVAAKEIIDRYRARQNVLRDTEHECESEAA